MYKLDHSLLLKVQESYLLKSKIDIFVDYEGEEKYIDLKASIWEGFGKAIPDLTPNDLESLYDICKDEKEVYVYSYNEVLEIFYPSIGEVNQILHNAIDRIDSASQIQFVLSNTVLKEKQFYNHVFNLNDNYIATNVLLNMAMKRLT